MINEMIPDWLYDLVKKSKPINKESYEQLQGKSYTSGKKIKIGDIILFGLSFEVISQDEINTYLIKFSPEEIGVIYEIDENCIFPKQKLPYLKLIQRNN